MPNYNKNSGDFLLLLGDQNGRIENALSHIQHLSQAQGSYYCTLSNHPTKEQTRDV